MDALAALGDRHAVPALLLLLQRDTPAAPAVLRALGSLGDPQAIPAVLARLAHGTPAVRKEALHALATLTEAPQAALVQQAIHQVIQSTDSESKELAESVRTLVTKYGERLRSAPIAMSAEASRHSLLGDSGMGATDSDFTPYATTVVSTSGASPVSATPPSFEALQLGPGRCWTDGIASCVVWGKGGFGIAVLVEDMVVNEEIILKFLHASLAADARLIKGSFASCATPEKSPMKTSFASMTSPSVGAMLSPWSIFPVTRCPPKPCPYPYRAGSTSSAIFARG